MTEPAETTPSDQPTDGAPADPEAPWALQLAVRVEKLTPPTTAAACAATTLATITLLEDERSQPDGEWHEPVTAWNGARIRKLVRRGRASAWERAQEPAGVTVERDGAEVRAFVPSPTDQAPSELRKLQIQSTPLDEIDTVDALPSLPAGAMVIAITPLFEMSWGKQAAQCAHAGQRLWMLSDSDDVAAWDGAARPIIIVHPNGALWARLETMPDEPGTVIRIHDGGFTEIPPGTNTTIAWFAPEIDG